MTKLECRNEGYIGGMLERFLRNEKPVHWIRIALSYHNYSTQTDVFSEGDFRPDVLQVARGFVTMDHKYQGVKGKLPSNWEQRVLDFVEPTILIKGTNGWRLEVGTLDMKRVAEIAKGGYVSNPKRDDKGRQILSRDDFLVEFRGSIADQLLNSNKDGDPTKMLQAPTEIELEEMVEGAGMVYNHYMSIPVGSLMVTKDFIFPYVIGRKQFPDLRWKDHRRYCGQSHKGARIPTADICVHLTGVDNNCAPHMMKNPVFRADFSFPMEIIGDTFTVPKDQERDYVERAVESLGNFGSIWVQNPPYEIIGEHGMIPSRGHSWHPNKDELIKVYKLYLGIDE